MRLAVYCVVLLRISDDHPDFPNPQSRCLHLVGLASSLFTPLHFQRHLRVCRLRRCDSARTSQGGSAGSCMWIDVRANYDFFESSSHPHLPCSPLRQQPASENLICSVTRIMPFAYLLHLAWPPGNHMKRRPIEYVSRPTETRYI